MLKPKAEGGKPINTAQPFASFAFQSSAFRFSFQWGVQDSNLRRHKPSDLQSDPFDRFGNSPVVVRRRPSHRGAPAEALAWSERLPKNRGRLRAPAAPPLSE